MRVCLFLILILVGSGLSRMAAAAIVQLPTSVSQDVLSESVPTAFAPGSWDTDDYAVEWAGKPIPGIEAELESGSLQWVRVAEVLVVPRAKLRLRGTGRISGQVVSAGYNQGFVSTGGVLASVPVALISGETNPIKITAIEGGSVIRGELRIRFRPKKKGSETGIGVDPSCSRFGVKAAFASERDLDSSWAYIGCRMVSMVDSENKTASLEILVFWDGVAQTLRADGVETTATIPSVWAFREHADPGKIALESDGKRMEIGYTIADILHYGSLGVGLGGYSFDFSGPSSDYHVATPMLTLYGSYFLTEGARLVAFDATTFNSSWTTDFGLFLNSESLRILDRRIAINVMLGAHVVAFEYRGSYIVHLGAPQGIEAIYNDAFGKNRNLSVGGFVYPQIDGKAYYNIWLRYGGATFVEFNYIAWKETVDLDSIFSRSVGISVGFPLARFF